MVLMSPPQAYDGYLPKRNVTFDSRQVLARQPMPTKSSRLSGGGASDDNGNGILEKLPPQTRPGPATIYSFAAFQQGFLSDFDGGGFKRSSGNGSTSLR